MADRPQPDQALGATEDVLALEPLDAKLDAFGFHVVVADGHDSGRSSPRATSARAF